LTARLQNWMDRRNLSLGTDLLGRLSPQLGTVGFDLLRVPLRAVETGFDLVVVLFVSIYWLIQTPGMLRFALSLVADGEQARLGEILHDMGRAMGGYLRGVAINGAILGVATYVALSIIHVDYPLVLGLLAAVLEFIPVLGATVAAGLVVMVALSKSVSLALLALGIEVVLHQTEGHILVPNIMHRQTNISPLLAVLAVLGGATVGGIIGAFISIPIVAAVQVVVAEIVAPAVRKRTGARPVVEEHDNPITNTADRA
jgi:predicted PurR-regulated permease PerM